METKSRSTMVLSVIIAVLAIAAGSLWYAHSGLKTEMAQQLDVHRALEAERDGLKTESQSQRERISALGSDVQALQGSRDEKATEVQQLSASAAESLQRYQALGAEKDAQSQQLAQALDQAKAIASARDALSSELASTKKTLDEARARASERNVAFEQLQQKHAQLEAAEAASQAEVKKLQQLQQDAQKNLQALNAEKVTIAQTLVVTQDQAKSAAAAGERLTGELASARQALGEAQANAAQQKTAFAQLQDKHTQLEAADLARQAELKKMQQLQQDAQNNLQTLNAEKVAIAQTLVGAQDQAKSAAAAGERLTGELASAKQALGEAQANVAQQKTTFAQLQDKHTQLEAADLAKQAELKKMQQLQQDAQQNLQTLNAEKVAINQKLVEAQDQAKSAAAAGERLTGELASARQALGEAQASIAQQKTAFAQLQDKHTQLEAAELARQAELKKMQQLQQDAQQNLQTLNAEKVAIAQTLAGTQDQAKSAVAAGERLTGELAAAKQALGEAQASVAQQKTVFAQLQDKHTQLEAADLARQAELKKMQQLQQDAQQKLQALEAENASIAQKLAGVQGQAKAAATAGASLSRALDSTKQTLVEARSRAADLNKSYQKLLKDHSNLSATNVARKAELDGMRAAFEEAQNEVARLTGARGIYTVQAADSLSSIAAYFYRKGGRWTDIQKENDFLAGNPDLIYAGQVLIIPK